MGYDCRWGVIGAHNADAPHERDRIWILADANGFNTKAHHMRGADKGKPRKPRSYGATGPLNPQFVEWLMGWPANWTDLKPLEMARFHEWQQQHSL